jgi:hypothetical protein
MVRRLLGAVADLQKRLGGLCRRSNGETSRNTGPATAKRRSNHRVDVGCTLPPTAGLPRIYVT